MGRGEGSGGQEEACACPPLTLSEGRRGEEGGGGGIFHLAARKQDVSPPLHLCSCPHIHIKVTGFGGDELGIPSE